MFLLLVFLLLARAEINRRLDLIIKYASTYLGLILAV